MRRVLVHSDDGSDAGKAHAPAHRAAAADFREFAARIAEDAVSVGGR